MNNIPRPPQYVLISFDGSYGNKKWQETREFGISSGARFTHFISGVDFLVGSDSGPVPGETKSIYKAPKPTGLCSPKRPNCHSDIGFGGTVELVNERISQVSLSLMAGMEIAGHGNAHFNGSTWSQQDWTYEFNWFHQLIGNVFSINKIKDGLLLPRADQWKSAMLSQMKGFRAPYLKTSAGLFETLVNTDWQLDGQKLDVNYNYDASGVTSELSQWPKKSEQGIWQFPLAQIPVPGRTKKIVSMDYNFYANQSGDKEDLVNASKYEEQMYQAYVNWFTRNYHGNRAPINIGHHFSNWNGGAYWRALQRFIKSVCLQAEVKCVTYSEMVKVLESQNLASVSVQLNSGKFDNSDRPQVMIPLVGNVSHSNFEGEVKNLVKAGRFGILKSSELNWSLNDKVLNKKVDLIKLAQAGHSNIDIVATPTGEKVRLFIDWNPILNSVRLLELQEDKVTPCSGKSSIESPKLEII